MHRLALHASAAAPSSAAAMYAFSARAHAMTRRGCDADGSGGQEEGIRRSERILRGIGIASRLLAPISVGLLLALCNVQTAAAGIAAWTLVTIPIGAPLSCLAQASQTCQASRLARLARLACLALSPAPPAPLTRPLRDDAPVQSGPSSGFST